MKLEDIKKAQSATVVVAYKLPKGVPEWLGTGFLVANGEFALTCFHVIENCKRYVQEDNITKELCCFLFLQDKTGYRFMPFPIVELIEIILPKIESTYYGPPKIDVALLKIDTSFWRKTFPQKPIPTLMVDESITSEVGDDVSYEEERTLDENEAHDHVVITG